MGGSDPGGGQPGQLGGGGLPDGERAAGFGGGPAQVGDQGRHGQPAVRSVAAADPLDRHVVTGQLGQEPGRPQIGVLAARGGDHQPPPGPRDRHVEQPALLGQQLGSQHRGIHVGALAPAGGLAGPCGFGKLPRAQHRSAQPQVRPALLLDARDHHHVPLQALGPVRGQDPDAIVADGALGQRVADDLLPARLSANRPGEPGGMVSAKCAALSNRASP